MSDHKKTAAKRRDARHTKSSDKHQPVAGKKDTKRWCRGKVGVEHVTKCVRYVDIKRDYISRVQLKDSEFRRWQILICTVCGKELAHWWPSALLHPPEKKPYWVTM